MKKKKIVVALGHKALGTTLPQQKTAVKAAAKAIADLADTDCRIVSSHSNAPHIGMIHTAMNEFGKQHPDYTFAPMSVCSAMSQGYIGYDLQNAIREELLNRGIHKPVTTVLTQVIVNPYDDSFYKPVKIIGRVMSEEEARAEEEKGNHVVKTDAGYRRIVSAPKPEDIVEIDAIRTLSDAGHIVIACGGGGIPVLKQGHRLKGASAGGASGCRYAPALNRGEIFISELWRGKQRAADPAFCGQSPFLYCGRTVCRGICAPQSSGSSFLRVCKTRRRCRHCRLRGCKSRIL